MEFLQTLMNLANAGEEIDERKFPWPNEYYTLYMLRLKFPSLTLDKLRQLIAEELVLKNITNEQGLTEHTPSSSLF